MLATIGYEQSTQAAVLDALSFADVEVLVDVRAVAASRRPGFSKSQISAGVVGRDIGYLHMRALGTPADGRQAARAGRSDELERIFRAHMATPAAQEDLAEVIRLVEAGRRICLMCYERDHRGCHRRFIAEAVAEATGAEILNLQA